MPSRLGDPGVFVCGPDDIAPWEKTPRRTSNDVPAAPRRRLGGWLVLAICPACVPKTRHYCSEHERRNWWLENYRPR
jgi:hypothetical protein